MKTAKVARIRVLTEAYVEAGKTINGFGDRAERDLGLGTLRTDATRALQRLRLKHDVAADELNPLVEFVEGAKGGRVSEWTVKGLEKARGKAIRDVFDSLGETIATGAAAGVISVLLAAGLFVIDSGATFAVSLVTLGGGALWYFGRGVDAAVRGAEKALVDSWTWASALGRQAELAMKEPRKTEQETFRALQVTPPSRVDSLTARARSIACSVVIATWAALGIAAVLFAIGMARGIDSITATLARDQPFF